ncbi:MAG TPA: hypothetical protein EYP07_14800 [Kiloniellaceae bacterium]|nr:hypothetical protein [Kiloniellaceae bacterium]
MSEVTGGLPIPKRRRKGKALGVKAERNKALIAAYKRGASCRDLGRRFGISMQAAFAVLQRHAPGAIRPRSRYREEDAEIVRRYVAGEQTTALARAFNCSTGRIYYVCRRDAPAAVEERRLSRGYMRSGPQS